MDKTKYQPVMIGISQAGDWFYYTGPTEKIEEDTWLNGQGLYPGGDFSKSERFRSFYFSR